MSFGRGNDRLPSFQLHKAGGQTTAGREEKARQGQEAWRSPSPEGSPHLSQGCGRGAQPPCSLPQPEAPAAAPAHRTS